MPSINTMKTRKSLLKIMQFIRIKGTIIDEIRRNGPVSRTGMNKLKDYRLAVESLQHSLKRIPTEEEICQELQITSKQLGQVYDTASYLATQSLEKMIFNDEGNGGGMGDMLVRYACRFR